MGVQSQSIYFGCKANLTETVDSEPPILETTVRKRDCCIRFCLYFSSGVDSDQEAIPWATQIQGYLIGKYKNYGWGKPILRQLIIHREKITTIQAYLINDIRKLQYESIKSGEIRTELNIQFSSRRNLKKAQTQIVHQSNQIQPQRSTSEAPQVEITIPHRANSLLEDYAQQQSNQPKEDGDKIFYKKAMEMIENHLKNPHNPLQWIMALYLKYFEEQKLKETRRDSNRLLEPLMNISHTRHIPKRSHLIVEDVKCFTDFFLLAMYSFYNLDRILEEQVLPLFNMPNLSSFAMTILFRNDLLFGHVFGGLQQTNSDETERYFHSIRSMINKRPSFYGVPRHLELMEDTIEELQLNRFQSHDPNCDNSYMRTLSKHSKPPSFKAPEEEKLQTEKDGEENIVFALFLMQQALHQSDKTTTVHPKAHTTDLIQYSINSFYLRNNLRLLNNFGADELVPILCYVIVQSQIRDLGSYLKLIENFTPRQILNSSAGYKLVTLQSCFLHLSHWDELELKRSKLISEEIVEQQSSLESERSSMVRYSGR